jgi:hypothetical protein
MSIQIFAEQFFSIPTAVSKNLSSVFRNIKSFFSGHPLTPLVYKPLLNSRISAYNNSKDFPNGFPIFTMFAHPYLLVHQVIKMPSTANNFSFAVFYGGTNNPTL